MAVRNQNPFIGSTEPQWRDEKYDYDGSGNMIYLGRSLAPVASASEGELWWIWKFTYDGSDVLQRRQSDSGNWDDRVALGWS